MKLRTLEITMQAEFFDRMINRLVKAPINLYYDVTPTSRVLKLFNSDLGAINSGFFHSLKDVVLTNVKFFLIVGRAVWEMPNIIPIILIIIWNTVRINRKYKHCRPTIWRVCGSYYEAMDTHRKISYNGR